jgi:hypothetical protein
VEPTSAPHGDATASVDPEQARAMLARLMAQVDERTCFGPSFFLTHLGALVRDRCPEAGEVMPVVELHLASGDVLDVCHVIGVTPGWLALAVFEERTMTGPAAMRTELVPYASIHRVTIRAATSDGRRPGFSMKSPTSPVFESTDAPPSAERLLALLAR